MTEYGAKLERGIVERVQDGKPVIRSLDRPGIVTPMIGTVAGKGPNEGDMVWFWMTDDGTGGVVTGGDASQDVQAERKRAEAAEEELNQNILLETNRAKREEAAIRTEMLTEPHRNVNGSSGLIAYPTDVGNYRVTSTRFDGLPEGCGLYGSLHIYGGGHFTHLYRDVNNNLWIGYTADSVHAPDNWKILAETSGIQTGVFSNDYCTVYASWEKIGRTVTMSVNMTTKQDISTSSGRIELTGVPASLRSCSHLVFSSGSAQARTRSVEMVSNGLWFYGTFASGTAYFASISYIAST